MKKINWIVLIVLYSCGGMLILLHAAIRVVTSKFAIQEIGIAHVPDRTSN